MTEIDLGAEPSDGDATPPNFYFSASGPTVELRGNGSKYDREMVAAGIEPPPLSLSVYADGGYIGEIERVEIRDGRKIGIVSRIDAFIRSA